MIIHRNLKILFLFLAEMEALDLSTKKLEAKPSDKHDLSTCSIVNNEAKVYAEIYIENERIHSSIWHSQEGYMLNSFAFDGDLQGFALQVYNELINPSFI